MTAPAHDGPVCVAAGCTRQQAPGAQLCARDEERLGTWIAQIGDEYARLNATPSMQGREAGTIGGTTLASHRSVGLLDVMAMRDPRSKERSEDDPDGNDTLGVYEVLHAYAEQVREERNIEYPKVLAPRCATACMHRSCILGGVGRSITVPLTILTERRVLAAEFNWIITQDWAGEFHDKIRQVWGQLQVHTGPGGRRAGYVATCVCGGRIRWVDQAATCQACGTSTVGLDVIRRHSTEAVA